MARRSDLNADTPTIVHVATVDLSLEGLLGAQLEAFAANFGNASIGNLREEALNSAIGATVRRQFTNDLSGRLQVRGTYEQDILAQNNGAGEQFIVKDIFTLSNTSTNKTATSGASTIKRIGSFVGANADIKGRYIIDGTFRYDGSSLFGEGNRWAPFGRARMTSATRWRGSDIAESVALPHGRSNPVRRRGTAVMCAPWDQPKTSHALSLCGVHHHVM